MIREFTDFVDLFIFFLGLGIIIYITYSHVKKLLTLYLISFGSENLLNLLLILLLKFIESNIIN